MTTILVIPDAHARPDETHDEFARFEAIGKLIVKRRPDHVVCLGDLGDLSSLSEYTKKAALAFDGAAVKQDVKAFETALHAIMSPVRSASARQRKAGRHHRALEPELHFLEGNHEERWRRYPETRLLGHDHLAGIAAREGWNWSPLGEPVDIEGVLFAHYFTTGTSRLPVGIGQALGKTHRSCVWGHSHSFGFDQKPVLAGLTISAVCAGSFRPPRFTGPHDWSGLIMLHNVRRGAFDIEQIGYRRVLRESEE